MARKKAVRKRKVSDVGSTTGLIEVIETVGGADAQLMSDEDRLLSEVGEWVPTGFPWLDRVWSNGLGGPTGRCFQIYGKFATGKSALAQFLAALYQGMNYHVIYIDAEIDVQRQRLAQYNYDPERFIHVVPESAESAWNAVHAALNYAKECRFPVFIVWDSIAASMPDSEKGRDAGKATVAELARVMSRGGRRLQVQLAKSGSCLCFVNQLREAINKFSPGGKSFVRPGGHAADFFCSSIIRTTRIKTIKEKDIPAGFLIQAVFEKNRFARPFQFCNLVLDFEEGPSPVKSTFHYLLHQKKLLRTGKSYKLRSRDAKRYDVGTFTRDEFPDVLAEHKDAFDALFARMARAGATLQPISDDDDDEIDDE